MGIILLVNFLIALVAFWIPKKYVKEFSISFAISFLLFSLYLYTNVHLTSEFSLVYHHEFLKGLGGSFFVGVNGLAYLLIVLTNLTVLYVMFLSWNKDYDASFYGAVFFMQFALIGVFSSLNALLFYFFWELALFPIYYIIYRWGSGEEKQKTFVRFFIYTFIGSLFILAAFILLMNDAKPLSFDFNDIAPIQLNAVSAKYYLILLFIGLGVKVPIFPLHSWQADTYTKAPAEGTILLSAIMLKMGLFGLIRWFMPFHSGMLNHPLQTFLIVLSVIGVIYGAIIALRRQDLKLILAFSSLSHVGLIAAGLFTGSMFGIQGSSIQMIVHGINILGLFYIVDLIEQSTGTRKLSDLGGIAAKNPIFAVLSFILIAGSIAVPLTNGFPGEMLLLYAIYTQNAIIGVVAGLTIIIGAAYMLRIYQLGFMGEVSSSVQSMAKIQPMHLFALGTLAILVIVIGLKPQFILDQTVTFSTYLSTISELKK